MSIFSALTAPFRKAEAAAEHPAGAEPREDTVVDINVTPIGTPNPDARMFRVDEALVPSGTYEYNSVKAAADAPLAARLLGVSGVELVLIAPRFVTVRKLSERVWSDLEPLVIAQITESLQLGEMAVLETEVHNAPAQRTAIEVRILELLDEEIRPAIAQDGGDVTFVEFRDGIVYLKLIGSCGTCPSSVTTLKMGIERLMMEEIPEVQGVEHA